MRNRCSLVLISPYALLHIFSLPHSLPGSAAAGAAGAAGTAGAGSGAGGSGGGGAGRGASRRS